MDRKLLVILVGDDNFDYDIASGKANPGLDLLRFTKTPFGQTVEVVAWVKPPGAAQD